MTTIALCPICYDSSTIQNPLVAVSGPQHPYLHHLFHENCISPWIQMARQLLCPTCRLPITELNGNRISLIATAEEYPLIVLVRRGDLAGVELAVARENISLEIRKLAIQEAAQNGNEAIVLAILGTNQDLLVSAATGAAIGGHAEIVRILLDYGPISESDFNWLLHYASTRGHTEAVEVLLAGHAFSMQSRGWVVRVASQEGHEGVVRLLLAKGGLSHADRHFAYKAAYEKGHWRIVADLFLHGMTMTMKGHLTIQKGMIFLLGMTTGMLTAYLSENR